MLLYQTFQKENIISVFYTNTIYLCKTMGKIQQLKCMDKFTLQHRNVHFKIFV